MIKKNFFFALAFNYTKFCEWNQLQLHPSRSFAWLLLLLNEINPPKKENITLLLAINLKISEWLRMNNNIKNHEPLKNQYVWAQWKFISSAIIIVLKLHVNKINFPFDIDCLPLSDRCVENEYFSCGWCFIFIAYLQLWNRLIKLLDFVFIY